MLKKIFCAAVLLSCTLYMAATFILINAASAQDVWVGTEGGVYYYVMDETFVNKTQYRDNRSFEVDVKLVRGDDCRISKMSFYENDGLIFFSYGGNDKSFPVYKNTTAKNIWEYGLKHLGIDYEVSYR